MLYGLVQRGQLAVECVDLRFTLLNGTEDRRSSGTLVPLRLVDA